MNRTKSKVMHPVPEQRTSPNKRFRFYLILTALLVVLLGFNSCLSMSTEITVNRDGSLEMDLDYQISQYVVNYGQVDASEPFLPLPVSREDFENRVLAVDGAELDSYRDREDEDYLYIQAGMSFDNAESAALFFQTPLSLSSQGGGSTFSYRIIDGRERQLDPDLQDAIETLFAGDRIVIILNTPTEIRTYSDGEISDNRRSLRYEKDITELLEYREEILWEVSW